MWCLPNGSKKAECLQTEHFYQSYSSWLLLDSQLASSLGGKCHHLCLKHGLRRLHTYTSTPKLCICCTIENLTFSLLLSSTILSFIILSLHLIFLYLCISAISLVLPLPSLLQWTPSSQSVSHITASPHNHSHSLHSAVWLLTDI